MLRPNTDPSGNSTSVDQEGQQEPAVIALVDNSKAVNQEETNNVDESTKPNKTSNERPIINKKNTWKRSILLKIIEPLRKG